MVKTKIIEKNDKPIMSASGGIDHLLKPKDREMIRHVLRNLESRGIETYITGGVLTDHLFNGNTDYNDIDLVGVIKKGYLNSSATQLVKALIRANDSYKSLRLDSYPVSESGDKMREDDAGLKIFKSFPGEQFQVIGNYGGQLTYVGLPIDERFKLRPERNSISRGLETHLDKKLQKRLKLLRKNTDWYNHNPEDPMWQAYQDLKLKLERGNLLPWTKTDIDLNLIAEHAFEEGDIFTPRAMDNVLKFGPQIQTNVPVAQSESEDKE